MNDDRILILAPHGRNAQLAADLLRQGGFSCHICGTMARLAEEIGRGAGAVLLTAEALAGEEPGPLLAALEKQPPWSVLPLLLVAASELVLDRSPLMQRLATRTRLIRLEQPMAARELLLAAEEAVDDSRRQQQVATLLRQLDTLNDQLEDSVAERLQEVQKLASHLSRAEQRERDRIARILHDHLQQILYGIQIQSQMAAQSLSPEEKLSAAALEQVNLLLVEAIDSARTLTTDLTPPILQKEGLGPALHWLAERMASRHNLSVEVEIGVGPAAGTEMAEDQRFLLFQVARELLFNVVKHAGVSKAQLCFRRDAEQCLLQVRDAGLGFDEAVFAVAGAESYGLHNIRERIALFGGSFQIDSAPGRGTTATLTLPEKWEEREEA